MSAHASGAVVDNVSVHTCVVARLSSKSGVFSLGCVAHASREQYCGQGRKQGKRGVSSAVPVGADRVRGAGPGLGRE
eukprot:13911128-Heterocapsa_arctica.AAC.1